MTDSELTDLTRKLDQMATEAANIADMLQQYRTDAGLHRLSVAARDFSHAVHEALHSLTVPA